MIRKVASGAAFCLMATSVFALTLPVAAQTSEVFVTKTYSEDVTLNHDSNVAIQVNKEISLTKELNYVGTVVISGGIEVDASALSLIQDSQIINGNFVDILDGSATLTNITVVGGSVLSTASGNIALNAAVGDAILQENVGNLAAIGSLPGASGDAQAFAHQKSFDNQFDDGEGQVDSLNQASLLGDVLGTASGNAAVNISSGALNAQKNLLALAAVIGSAMLSDTMAAILQEVSFNTSFHNLTTNEVRLSEAVAANFTGNIAINMSAGTNILQINSLMIASAQ